MKTPQSALPETLQQAILFFADRVRALEFLARFRWPDGKPTCPRCGSVQHSFISTRQIWKCKGCKKQFSAKTGTIMEDSPIGLDKWLPAIWMICGCKNGVSSWELHRALGVCQKTAWFMLHRIRLAMQSGSLEKLSGEIEADETFVGGKIANMHRRSKRHARAKSPGTNWNKTIVLGLFERESKSVRAAVSPSRTKHHVEGHLTQHVEPGSTLYTDELPVYGHLSPDYARQFVNHLEKYVEGRVHTNGLENFWSLLKRSLKGTYVSVDPAHLQAYVDEQAFRFNNREFTDADRFVSALSQIAGKRLTFAGLTGREMGGQVS